MTGWVKSRIEFDKRNFFAEVWFENQFLLGVSALVLVGLHGDLEVFDFGDGEAVNGFEGVSAACVALAHFCASVND